MLQHFRELSKTGLMRIDLQLFAACLQVETAMDHYNDYDDYDKEYFNASLYKIRMWILDFKCFYGKSENGGN